MIDPLALEFPDYPGSNHSDTPGNLNSNPAAGITFIDGAQRPVRFTCHAGVRVERAVPVRFKFIVYAPRLPASDPPL